MAFPLFFWHFIKWSQFGRRHKSDMRDKANMIDISAWLTTFYGGNSCNVLLSLLIFRGNCSRIIFTFLPEQKWRPEGSFLRRRANGKALRRKRSAESTSQLLTALSKDLHVIWKKSKGYGRSKYENIPKLYFSHHPRNILLCPAKCNIKKGTLTH